LITTNALTQKSTSLTLAPLQQLDQFVHVHNKLQQHLLTEYNSKTNFQTLWTFPYKRTIKTVHSVSTQVLDCPQVWGQVKIISWLWDVLSERSYCRQCTL